LIWSKPTGLYVTAKATVTGAAPILGTPQEWADKLKWEKAFESKKALKEVYSVSVTVPLKYARKAQDIYQSEFRNLGTMEETDTYIFKSEDVADDFIHALVAAGIPNDGINQQLMETTKVKKQSLKEQEERYDRRVESILTQMFGAFNKIPHDKVQVKPGFLRFIAYSVRITLPKNDVLKVLKGAKVPSGMSTDAQVAAWNKQAKGSMVMTKDAPYTDDFFKAYDAPQYTLNFRIDKDHTTGSEINVGISPVGPLSGNHVGEILSYKIKAIG